MFLTKLETVGVLFAIATFSWSTVATLVLTLKITFNAAISLCRYSKLFAIDLAMIIYNIKLIPHVFGYFKQYSQQLDFPFLSSQQISCSPSIQLSLQLKNASLQSTPVIIIIIQNYDSFPVIDKENKGKRLVQFLNPPQVWHYKHFCEVTHGIKTFKEQYSVNGMIVNKPEVGEVERGYEESVDSIAWSQFF